MNMYITGRMHEENGKQVFQVAAAISGKQFKLFKADMPEETTPAEALAKAMGMLQNYCQRHPSVYDGKSSVTVKQNIVDYDMLFREPVHEAWESLAKTFGMNTAPFGDAMQVTDYIVDSIDKRLFDRIDKKDKSYHFREGDFIIGRRVQPEDETPEQARKNALEFEMCARVLSVNRDENTVLLDKYQERGNLQNHHRTQTLSELELTGWYEPMTNEEIIELRDGMAAMLESPRQSRKLEDKNLAMQTFDAVNELAEQIEREAGKPKDIADL